MTAFERELARRNAEELRKPKVDVFAQSKIDQRNAKPPKPVIIIKKKPFVGGIPKVDAQLNDAGVFQDD